MSMSDYMNLCLISPIYFYFEVINYSQKQLYFKSRRTVRKHHKLCENEERRPWPTLSFAWRDWQNPRHVTIGTVRDAAQIWTAAILSDKNTDRYCYKNFVEANIEINPSPSSSGSPLKCSMRFMDWKRKPGSSACENSSTFPTNSLKISSTVNGIALYYAYTYKICIKRLSTTTFLQTFQSVW